MPRGSPAASDGRRDPVLLGGPAPCGPRRPTTWLMCSPARAQADEALAVFQDLTKRSSDGRHWGLPGDAARDHGDHDGAKRCCKRPIPYFARRSVRAHYPPVRHVNLGGVLTNVAHNYTEAAAEYRAAVKLDPEDAKAHFGLGNVLREQGKLDEAAASYRCHPHQAQLWPAHHNLAYVMIRQGNVDGAIAEGRESLRLQPDAAAVPGNLAWLLAFSPDRPARDYEEAATLCANRSICTPKVPSSTTWCGRVPPRPLGRLNRCRPTRDGAEERRTAQRLVSACHGIGPEGREAKSRRVVRKGHRGKEEIENDGG